MARRLPAEFEKQEAILLCFPHEGEDWPGKYQAVQWAMVDFIKKITTYERVVLIVKGPNHRKKVEEKLGRAHVDLQMIQFLEQDTDRSWMRDSGPIVIDNQGFREAIRFDFNAWAKYDNYKKDRKVAGAVSKFLQLPVVKARYEDQFVVLEGGAIDGNGEGSLITTEECLLDPVHQVRNPGFSKEDYENTFEEFLGVQQVLWLGHGIEGDDTHGHIDDICRFINPDTVVLAEEKDPSDYNHRVLEENRERLENLMLANGKKLDVIRIPMPGRINFEGMRLPASYINFLILNDAVLVPTFNDSLDYRVLGLFREVMPNRDVIGIHALDLIWGLGTLHCLSHEIPH